MQQAPQLFFPTLEQMPVVRLVLPEDSLHGQATHEIERHLEGCLCVPTLSASSPFDAGRASIPMMAVLIARWPTKIA